MEFLKKFLSDQHASSDDQENHTVYWIPSQVFSKLPIKRWKHNRPADNDRVVEIRNWMQTTKRMDGIIYIAYVNNELVCYESNHRREALVGIEGMHHILVDILWDATDDSIKAEFQRLNKAVSVPDLYVEDTPIDSISQLTEVVKSFCENYKKLKVNTNRPQRPHFNRDMLMDEFYRIMRENKISIEELGQRLSQLNQIMSMRDKSKLQTKVVQKCEESGLWLFAWSSKLEWSELSNNTITQS